jgi:hypothetical protein
LFLALQGADRTLPVAWMLLTSGGLLGVAFSAIDWQRPLSNIERAIAVALVACALSIALGLDPQRSLMLSVPALAGLLLWILIARGRYAPVFPSAAIGLLVAALVQSALLLLAARRRPYATPGEWVGDAGAAWLVVPNDIAWMACILPLLALVAGRHAGKALVALLVAFAALCLVVHSRTAAIVAIAVALSFVASSFPKLWRGKRKWRIVMAGAGVVAIPIAFSVASMHARWQLWKSAWAIFLDHPWTGVGLHNFVLAYHQYLPASAELVDPRTTPWPHNLILEIAAECGLIGVLAVLFLVRCVVRRGMVLNRATSSPLHRAVFSGCFGIALLALTEASLLRQWVWIVGAALCALLVTDSRVYGKQENEERFPATPVANRRLRRAARRQRDSSVDA